MLVLTRKPNETIDIYYPHADGDVHRVSVTVLRSKDKNQVRLGLDGERDVHFLRREVEDDGRTGFKTKGDGQ